VTASTALSSTSGGGGTVLSAAPRHNAFTSSSSASTFGEGPRYTWLEVGLAGATKPLPSKAEYDIDTEIGDFIDTNPNDYSTNGPARI